MDQATKQGTQVLLWCFIRKNYFGVASFTGSGRNWIDHLIEMSTGTQTSAKARTIRINLEGGAQA